MLNLFVFLFLIPINFAWAQPVPPEHLPFGRKLNKHEEKCEKGDANSCSLVYNSHKWIYVNYDQLEEHDQLLERYSVTKRPTSEYVWGWDSKASEIYCTGGGGAQPAIE